MSESEEGRIRSFMHERAAGSVSPTTLDAIDERVRGLPQRPRGRLRLVPAAGLGITLVVALSVVLVTWAVYDDPSTVGEEPAGSLLPPRSDAPSPIASGADGSPSSAPPVPGSGEWESGVVALPQGHQASSLASVVTFAGGYIAIGTADGSPAIWDSPEAREWRSVYVRSDDIVASLNAVAASPATLVAVGSVELAGKDEAWIITSRDGIEWSEIAIDPEVFPPGSVLSDVTYDGAAYVASGGILASPSQLDGGRPMLWRSTTGDTWEAESTPSAAQVDGALWSVASSGGVVIAGGVEVLGVDEQEAILLRWTAAEGWTRVPGPALPAHNDSRRIEEVVGHGGGFLAIAANLPPGCISTGRCADAFTSWLTSDDGLGWSEAGVDVAISPVAGDPTGLIGLRRVDDLSLQLVLSNDGVAWREQGSVLVATEGASVRDISRSGDTVVAVGETQASPGLYGPAVWRIDVGP